MINDWIDWSKQPDEIEHLNHAIDDIVSFRKTYGFSKLDDATLEELTHFICVLEIERSTLRRQIKEEREFMLSFFK